MRTLVILLTAGLFVAPSVAGGHTVDDLAWISGTWEGTSGDMRQEEHWSRPAGGVILGLHRDLVSPDRAFFEFLRIEQRADGIFYVAMPGGRAGTDFRLTELEHGRAVFENPGHDFPQIITYHRTSDRALSIKVQAHQDGKLAGFELELTRRD